MVGYWGEKLTNFWPQKYKRIANQLMGDNPALFKGMYGLDINQGGNKDDIFI